jgi:vacuolar-type H+-ATPase subunit H
MPKGEDGGALGVLRKLKEAEARGDALVKEAEAKAAAELEEAKKRALVRVSEARDRAKVQREEDLHRAHTQVGRAVDSIVARASKEAAGIRAFTPMEIEGVFPEVVAALLGEGPKPAKTAGRGARSAGPRA